MFPERIKFQTLLLSPLRLHLPEAEILSSPPPLLAVKEDYIWSSPPPASK